MKQAEITKKSDGEIAELIKESRKALYELKVKGMTEALEKTQQKREYRRTIARLLTEQRARELKEQQA